MKLFAFLVLILGFSFAQADFEKGACKEDVEKFCKDVERGKGRIMKCLKEHEAELSEACKANGIALKEKMQDFKAACETDIKANCSDIKKGKGRILACLKKAPQVSEGCKEALPKK